MSTTLPSQPPTTDYSPQDAKLARRVSRRQGLFAPDLLKTALQQSSPSLGPLIDLLGAPEWSQINSPSCPPKLAALTRQPPTATGTSG